MSDDDRVVVRPAAFNGRPTAEQEIAQRGAEIFAEFQQRKDDLMAERIAQRVVELLRSDILSMVAPHQVDVNANGARARGSSEA